MREINCYQRKVSNRQKAVPMWDTLFILGSHSSLLLAGTKIMGRTKLSDVVLFHVLQTRICEICIACSHATVFLSNRLELYPSLEYNSRDLSISSLLKLLYLNCFWGFYMILICVFIENINN